MGARLTLGSLCLGGVGEMAIFEEEEGRDLRREEDGGRALGDGEIEREGRDFDRRLRGEDAEGVEGAGSDLRAVFRRLGERSSCCLGVCALRFFSRGSSAFLLSLSAASRVSSLSTIGACLRALLRARGEAGDFDRAEILMGEMGLPGVFDEVASRPEHDEKRREERVSAKEIVGETQATTEGLLTLGDAHNSLLFIVCHFAPFLRLLGLVLLCWLFYQRCETHAVSHRRDPINERARNQHRDSQAYTSGSAAPRACCRTGLQQACPSFCSAAAALAARGGLQTTEHVVREAVRDRVLATRAAHTFRNAENQLLGVIADRRFAILLRCGAAAGTRRLTRAAFLDLRFLALDQGCTER